MNQILSTKLFLPKLPPAFVPRDRLLDDLNAGLHRRLTLVSAPAGFGKTTLVSSWVEQLPPPWQSAWLSLDPNDSDLTRFLGYFLSALEQVDGLDLAVKDLMATLQVPGPAPHQALITTLVNRLSSFPDKILLVLDDYHLIEEPAIQSTLTYLLDHQPPQLHLVISTREDPPLPLPRLRARAQLSEMRAADLRFTHQETVEFLQHNLGVDLSSQDIYALEDRTEGWVAGLQLVAHSLQRNQDPGQFIQSFTGTHRFVLDYLLEEVLAQQAKHTQKFLLRTSILNQLCASLCDAVLQEETYSSQEILEELESSNLFIIALDDERRWYRYHHLFGDLLRQQAGQRLSTKELNLYHLNASDWYQESGDLSEAFQHAISAGDFEKAAGLAEIAWEEMDANLQSAAWLGWIDQLPEEVIHLRPVLCTQIAWSYTDTGQVEPSELRLQDAERCLAGPADKMIYLNEEQFHALPARIAFARAYNSLITGPPSAVVKHGEKALDLVPDDNPFLASQIKIVLGSAYWASGKLDLAARAMKEWIDSAQEAENIIFAIASGYGLADIQIAQGHLNKAQRTIQESLELASGHKEARGVIANHYLGLAALAHERGDDKTAAEYLNQGIRLAPHSTLVDTPYRLHIIQARLMESQGNLEKTLELLEKARAAYVESPIPNTRPVDALIAMVHLRMRQLDKARDWVNDKDLSLDNELDYMSEFNHIILARFLITEYQVDGDENLLQDALRLLERLWNPAELENRTSSMLEILVSQILAHVVQGDNSSAIDLLKRAIKLAEPQGYLRIFVNEGAPMAKLLYKLLSDGDESAYLQRLLGSFQVLDQEDTQSVTQADSRMLEPLSERELEVLQLIAEGLKNQEIADTLYISLHTVKIHARNIYAKLGVKNRTQAASRAKGMGILNS